VIVVRFDFHEHKGRSWLPAAGVVLLALLAIVATFQYRWLGEVSNAERERMRASLQTRASDFTQAFDRELTQIYLAFHFGPDVVERDAEVAIGLGLKKLQESARAPDLIRAVFLLEAQGPRANLLQRFDPSTNTLQRVEWPAELESWKQRIDHLAPLSVARVLPIFMTDAVDANAPALIIPLPFMRRYNNGEGRVAVVSDSNGPARSLIVWLDSDKLRQRLLEPLVAKYFGAGESSEYIVSIVQRDNPAHTIYTSAGEAPVAAERADMSAALFDLRMNELTRVDTGAGAGLPLEPRVVDDRVAITIVRRSSSQNANARFLLPGANQGAWVMRARYRRGSLESIVERSRRRNLAISLGVLTLLAAAFVLSLVAAQRQRRLAQQQMEFVAAVSHELRTPLAVICSAGENLADGVVAEAAQVKTYGSLIESEGRRLGDMVERVMEFAGISSGAAIRARADVDVATVIADAVRGVSVDAQARRITVAVHPHGPLPPVTGDADALRSAVQNIVGNAVKYSTDGGSVDVRLRADDGSVEILVADRGLGIDAADLPHIFKPFYRGRRAVDAQVRGTGVGLSVVRHVIQAHHGTVSVDSRPGEGTTVVVVLPA
jgi:signal transduction histidine kinase